MTKIISGIGSLEKLIDFKDQFFDKRILLVTGKGSFSNSGAELILKNILRNECVFRFSDFEVNPKFEDAERGVAFAREANIDVIMAVGGGSVIDMAKLIKAFYLNPENAQAMVKSKACLLDPKVSLIVVPTTAGSGSEATHFAVVHIGKEKYSLASSLLLPNAVFLDGKLISTCSAYQKACNGLDALAQAIESAWAVGSTEVSIKYAFKALKLCKKYLPKVLKDDAEYEALHGMLEAANFAGQAINISKTTAAHAWSYGITNEYGIPHGHAVWLTLPAIFQIHTEQILYGFNDKKGPKNLHKVMTDLMELLDITSPERSGDTLRNYLNGIGVASSLDMVGANSIEKRKYLSQRINLERMANNPINFNETDVAKIFSL